MIVKLPSFGLNFRGNTENQLQEWRRVLERECARPNVFPFEALQTAGQEVYGSRSYRPLRPLSLPNPCFITNGMINRGYSS